MKLKRAWIALCSRCGNDGVSFNSVSNITQTGAITVLRKRGWSDTKEGLLCPDCAALRKGNSRFIETVKALKSAGTSGD